MRWKIGHIWLGCIARMGGPGGAGCGIDRVSSSPVAAAAAETAACQPPTVTGDWEVDLCCANSASGALHTCSAAFNSSPFPWELE